ncbi:MAG: Xaa-Pro peptidase family protein [Intestinimonas sp.]|jgi:Xaa-Pro dipeptidase|nr:Xaa-Pro peptidase family protein [Intestinimonas sp.]
MNRERLDRVVANMKAEGLEQIVVSATASVYYLTGLWVEPFERMLALYLDGDGKATLFANEIFGISSTPELPVVAHRDGEDPVRDLAAVVRPGRLGIDKFYYSKFLIGLMEHRADIQPVQGSGPVDLARKCKDAREREAMRRSSRINDQVVAAAIALVKEGARENELAAAVNKLYLQHGADGEGPQLVCFGANGADPHHTGDGTVLKKGDSVIFDIFTPIDRYWCDMTRTVFYQSVSEKQRRVYELVRRANEAAIAKVRPGVLLSELDRTARGVIEAGGYGPYFTHRLGHGCGIECHEPPDVSNASDTPLEPGMVFSIEPGIYLPGEFGVRIEDLVMVTESGCEVLNAYPKDLTVVG